MTANRATRRSSFYWPMRLLPPKKREALFAIYGFCQSVDAIADSDAPEALKRQQLTHWQAEITALYEGKAETKLTKALLAQLSHYALPQHAFNGMLEGMFMDVDGMCCPEDSVLEAYCYNVASTVGLLAIEVFGYRHISCQRFAEHLGKGLQLINIMRDIEEDAQNGRVYIPRSIALGCCDAVLTPESVLALAPDQRAAIRKHLAQRAIWHFEQADAALHPEDRRAMLPALMMRNVYGCYLTLFAKEKWDCHGKLRIPGWRKVLAILQSPVALQRQPYYHAGKMT